MFKQIVIIIIMIIIIIIIDIYRWQEIFAKLQTKIC